MLQSLRRHGWSVVGIERTTQSAIPATAEHRLPMVVGSLDAIRPAPCLDLIIMFHVLEHLEDPLGALRQCVARLKPDGLLLISVPNLDSWQARWFGRHWLHLDVPRHLFHFSPSSLRHLLERVGLRVETVRYVSWEHDPYGWLQSGLNRLGFPPNLLTSMLMERELMFRRPLRTLVMGSVAAVLVVPSVGFALASWVMRRGAIIEVWAKRCEPR